MNNLYGEQYSPWVPQCVRFHTIDYMWLQCGGVLVAINTLYVIYSLRLLWLSTELITVIMCTIRFLTNWEDVG